MYRLTNSNSVIRLADAAFVPLTPGNRDYEEFRQWIELAGVPAQATPIAVDGPLNPES